MMGKERLWRRKGGAYDPEHGRSFVKHGGGEVTAWACGSAGGIGSAVFTDDVIPDGCRGMNSISNTFCSDSVMCSKTDRCVAVRTDYDSEHAAKAA